MNEVWVAFVDYLKPFFLPYIYSFLGVLFIKGITAIFEGVIVGLKITESKNIIDFLRESVYPFLTLIIGIVLAFIKRIDDSKLLFSIIAYSGMAFFNYKIIYKLVVNKIITQIRGGRNG